MAPKHPKRPKDFSQAAKFVIDAATGTGESSHQATRDADKNPMAMALGRAGGLKGGKARARKMSPEERRQIALKAARARWETK